MKKFLIITVLVLGVTAGNVGAFGFAQQYVPDKDYCLPFWKWALNKILPNSLDFECPAYEYENLLGAQTATGNFPTTFNNFQDNDIINAGDWDNIEYTIGTTTVPTGGFSSSTATSTLWYKLSNVASGNPGHYHTLSNDASATGTLPVRKGGTATTTFNNGFVIASGTDAFTSLQTNGAGSIPIASGTTWVANTLTAGPGISITNGTGTSTITATAAVSLKSATTTPVITVSASVATTTLATSSISALTLTTSTVLHGKLYFSLVQAGGSAENLSMNIFYGSNLIASSSFSTLSGNTTPNEFDFTIIGTGSASQTTITNWTQQAVGTGVLTAPTMAGWITSSTVDTSVAANLTVTARWSSTNGSNTYTTAGYYLNSL